MEKKKKVVSLEYENELFDRAIKNLGINKKDYNSEAIFKKVRIEITRLRLKDLFKDVEFENELFEKAIENLGVDSFDLDKISVFKKVEREFKRLLKEVEARC